MQHTEFTKLAFEIFLYKVLPRDLFFSLHVIYTIISFITLHSCKRNNYMIFHVIDMLNRASSLVCKTTYLRNALENI